MDVPLRTAYSQNGRCGMQPKAKPSSLRAQAQLSESRTQTKTFGHERSRKENARAAVLGSNLWPASHESVTLTTRLLRPQVDYAICYVARSTMDDNGVNQLNWPAQSSDLRESYRKPLRRIESLN
ncbi:hypothetical protein TNCV_1105301 [Trichonephila clavipes]|nr:hypothetical protein TNCV_1105301 [Trichonephila clavipes]